jgi:hypothetical protein
MTDLEGLTTVPLADFGDLTTVPMASFGVLTTVPLGALGGLTTVPRRIRCEVGLIDRTAREAKCAVRAELAEGFGRDLQKGTIPSHEGTVANRWPSEGIENIQLR